MRTKFALIVLTTAWAAGCSTGETPTPVPSNTPVPSATDTDTAPTRTEQPTASDDPLAIEPPATSETPAETPESEPPPQQPSDAEPEEPSPKPPDSDAEIKEFTELDPQQLVDHLADAQQRDITTRALVSKGSAAVEPLITALGSDNWEIRAAAIFTLGQLREDAHSALPRLKELSESDDVPAVRDAAAFAIDSIQP